MKNYKSQDVRKSIWTNSIDVWWPCRLSEAVVLCVRKSLTKIFSASIEKGKALRIRKVLKARNIFCNEIPQQLSAFQNVINTTSTFNCYVLLYFSLFLILLINQLYLRKKEFQNFSDDSLFLFIFLDLEEQQSLSLWKNNKIRSESERKTYINNLISQYFFLLLVLRSPTRKCYMSIFYNWLPLDKSRFFRNVKRLWNHLLLCRLIMKSENFQLTSNPFRPAWESIWRIRWTWSMFCDWDDDWGREFGYF